MADMYFVYGHANRNPPKAGRLYTEHYLQRRTASHILFTELNQLLCKSGFFVPRSSDRGRPQSVEIAIWKFAYREEWKKMSESVCKELQLLNTSVFPLSGDFFTNSHFICIISRECKPPLLIIVQGSCFADGFSQNAL
jgi:hypothetical protein